MAALHNRSTSKVLAIYKACLIDASKALLRNPWIVLFSFIAYMTYSLIANIFSGMGFAGGMLIGMAQIGLISLYYYWLSEIISGHKVKLETALTFNFQLFSGVLSVAFIFFIVLYLAQIFLQGFQVPWAIMLLQLGIVFIFNSIPEVIYLKNLESLEALSFSAEFTKRNWIEWYLPLLILLLPWVINESTSVLLVLAGTDPFLPSLMLIESAGHWTQALSNSSLPGLFLGVILTNWFMIFRGNLFLRL